MYNRFVWDWLQYIFNLGEIVWGWRVGGVESGQVLVILPSKTPTIAVPTGEDVILL
jgi:hypothetical protein